MGKEVKTGERVGDLISGMGRERLELRARGTAVLLLRISALLCLITALASLAGYIPYAIGPSIVLMVASAVGFLVSVLEAPHT